MPTPAHPHPPTHPPTPAPAALPPRRYAEIWLDEKPVKGATSGDYEPIYGAKYLPRKFKIGVAVPPSNDVDIYTQDLSFIAIAGADGGLEGFNVTIGGGCVGPGCLRVCGGCRGGDQHATGGILRCTQVPVVLSPTRAQHHSSLPRPSHSPAPAGWA